MRVLAPVSLSDFISHCHIAAANNGDSIWLTTNCDCSLATQDWTKLISAVRHQHGYSWFRVLWDSRPYFTLCVGSHYQATAQDTADWEELVCAVVNCKVCGSVKQLLVDMRVKSPINPVTNSNDSIFQNVYIFMSGLESREYCHRDQSRWPRGTLYPQRLSLTSPTNDGRSVGIVRSRTEATGFSLVHSFMFLIDLGFNLLQIEIEFCYLRFSCYWDNSLLGYETV
jgi:hypothetical protein